MTSQARSGPGGGEIATPTRTFRLFVSSTFEDMEAERNALHARVYPRLREFCAERNARFQPIDLRWGVSEEASLDQQAMEICLGEIRRCRDVTPRPNFLVLLGNRYGWLPPPPAIPQEEFERIRELVPEEERELLDWYRLDENAVPAEYRLRPRTEPPVAAGGEDYEDPKEWSPVEKKLHAALAAAAKSEAMDLDEDRRRVYEASATEQEIREGALSGRTADDQAFCLFREITGGPNPAEAGEDDPILKFMDPDQSPIESLKGELGDLPEGAIKSYEVGWDGKRPGTDHLSLLVEDARELLEAAIERELREPLRLDSAPDLAPRLHGDEELDAEGKEHRRFAEERSRVFEGREETLDAVAAYLSDDDPRPFVLHGEGGTGKSALLAEAVARAQGGDGELVYRFIGATPGSSSGRELLRGLCGELARRFGDAEGEVPDDYQKLVGDFRERLERAGAERPLLLFVDSLDQLAETDGARSLSWLPTPVPAGVRIVVSTRPGDILEPLERRQARLEPLGPLKRPEGERILRRWLEEAHRTLRPAQRDAVLDGFDASEGNPLWLRLAFEEARLWRSDKEPEGLALGIAPATGAEGVEGGIDGIVARNTLPRLAHEQNHGKVLVSRALGYLAASRYGLAEDELLGLLASDLEVYRWFVQGAHHLPPDLRVAAARHRGEDEDAATEWLEEVRKEEARQSDLDEFLRKAISEGDGMSLPVVLWSRLFADLGPYLSERSSEGGALIAFYHRELDEVAALAYLAGDEAQACQRRLADYFRRQADPDGDGSWSGSSVRGLSELPFHLTMGADDDDGRWQQLHDTLTDFRFLERKVAEVGIVKTGSSGDESTTYTGVFQLQDDFALALDRMPGGDGASSGRRPIIVTGTDLGQGLQIRCPYCSESVLFEEGWREKEMPCPRCDGQWKVNAFVVNPR